MKGKKTTIRAKAPTKRNPAARSLNQKAQVMSDGPKRMGTRKARERKDIEDHA
jgi:hypothetical protein